jgi:DNA-binding response OmpR family regulator
VNVFRQQSEQITLVLLDMTMPQLDGEETFREMRQIRGDVRAVLMSGYNEQTATSKFAGTGLAAFIQKPFRFEELQAVVRSVISEQ